MIANKYANRFVNVFMLLGVGRGSKKQGKKETFAVSTKQCGISDYKVVLDFDL